MTSTPASLNDESLNGSWIDINSASQIHSPMDDDSPEFMRPPYSLAESVQNLGLISFQVERFLQEANKNGSNINNNNNNNNNNDTNNHQQQSQRVNVDNISDIYLSDSDVSIEGIQGGQTLIDNLRKHHQQYISPNNNHNENSSFNYNNQSLRDVLDQNRMSKSDCILDRESDSLSFLSRASWFGETAIKETNHLEEFDWLWDWTAQPEYFTGQEWKIGSPRRDFIMRQRQIYCASLSGEHASNHFTGEMISLLFLTNILSIIIGAGLTYSVLMRRPAV